MMRVAMMALGVALLAVVLAAPAWAQPRAEIDVAPRADSAGDDDEDACFLTLRLRNASTSRLLVLNGALSARNARTGEELPVPMSQIAFSGVAPGETAEWGPVGLFDIRCRGVLLTVRGVVCASGCAAPAWRHRGIAGLEVAPR